MKPSGGGASDGGKGDQGDSTYSGASLVSNRYTGSLDVTRRLEAPNVLGLILFAYRLNRKTLCVSVLYTWMAIPVSSISDTHLLVSYLSPPH